MICPCPAITVAAARCKVEPRSGGEGWESKRSGWFYERLFGARSAAGSMTPLSQAYARARTQIPDAPLPCVGCGTRLAGASSRFLCLSFFAAAKKVSAAPHRGNTNRPLTMQGKAPNPEQEKPKTLRTRPTSAAGNNPPFNPRAPYCAAKSPMATPQTAPDTHWRNSQNAKTPTAWRLQ
ncbi:hypothetical protein SAMN05192563_1012189 [Paraburkholderia aspalathi]|uniref:Uncharacterized protein n=1 Tax=Paraburkholderia aspalathi TaxID=1324617 RepID=A0A1I7DZ53_9BURK|nr:hypothetical protein SAMN05192563_1012189 [Paraburkholderia aspalathi]